MKFTTLYLFVQGHDNIRRPRARITLMRILFCWAIFFTATLYAEKIGGSTQEFTKPLEVKGQSKNLNMALVLRSKNDRASFLKIRKDYRKEILSTQY